MVSGVLASEHHGTVGSPTYYQYRVRSQPPRATRSFSTTTDEKGVYAFADLADGVWTIQVEMLGFAKQSRDIGIAVDAPSPEWDLKLLTQADLTAAVAAAKAAARAASPSQAAAPATPLAATTAATTSPAAAAPAAPAPTPAPATATAEAKPPAAVATPAPATPPAANTAQQRGNGRNNANQGGRASGRGAHG